MTSKGPRLSDVQDSLEDVRHELFKVTGQLDLDQLDLTKLKKREAYIVMEFYRAAKDALPSSQFQKLSVEAIIPEMPLNGDKKADLVVFTRDEYSRRTLLVVECKQRPLTTFGRTYATATSQAWEYAKRLSARFLAVYDGWLLFVFRTSDPYLVGVYSVEIDKGLSASMLANLFVGLMEYHYSGRSQKLDLLPKPVDPDLLKRRILPSIARRLAAQYTRSAKTQVKDEEISAQARRLLKDWISRIIK